MTLDVGPFLEIAAPLSVIATFAYGAAKVIFYQQEHKEQFQAYIKIQDSRWETFNTKLDALSDKHRSLESRVLETEMYERGLADARARRRVMRGRSNKPRSKP